MKNLFDYATKELSQDAFLCWLFANYDCENKKVNEISVKLLSEFSFNLSADRIRELKLFKQWKYIDILVQFEYDGKIICIAIEDKTFSWEHEQLESYNEELDGYAKEIFARENKIVECHKVFYKTAILHNDEEKRVDDSGKWKIFDIRRIYEFFSAYSKTGSDILDDYITHINDLYNIFYNYKEIDFKNWIGNNFIFKQYCDINIKAKTTAFNRSEIYQGKYTATYIQQITENNIVVELAFFFRDSGFSTWIKCWRHGKRHNEKNKELIEQITRCIPNDLLAKWNRKIYLNRIMRVIKYTDEFTSFDEFDDWINLCIYDFDKVVKCIENIGNKL